MPKEVIQYPATDGESGTEIAVHWSKASEALPVPANEIEQGTVQIGVTVHDWTDDTKTFGLLSYVMSRDEINRLIRVLRRARDQAYGQDA